MGFTVYSLIDKPFFGADGIALLESLHGVALAIAVVTFVSLPGTLFIEIIIRRPVTSLVLVELVRVGIFWVVWLAAGVRYYQLSPLSSDVSSCYLHFQTVGRGTVASCIGVVVVAASSMINFGLLLIWFITLLFFAVKNNHWKSLVHRVDLTEPKSSSPADTQNDHHRAYWNAPQFGSPYLPYPLLGAQSQVRLMPGAQAIHLQPQYFQPGSSYIPTLSGTSLAQDLYSAASIISSPCLDRDCPLPPTPVKSS